MKKLNYIIAFTLLLLGGSGADLRAQTPPNPPATSWYPPPSVQPPTLAVTSASARVALPAAPTTYPVVTVVNVGAQEIFCRLGDATVTVTTGSYEFSIPANNGYRAVWDASSAYVACITASSTSTARITQSNGGPTLGFNGAPASLPPSGAAGGDLAGTYPNPSVVSYNSGTVFGTAAAVNTGTSGATVPLLNGVNTWSGAQTINGASFGLTGNITGAAIFGTNGIRYKNVAGTLSDTTSSGTVAANYDSKFGGNTLTATSATTITNNYGSYFTAPICSTNVTCTANWALGADSLFDAGKLGLASGSIVAWNADTGLSRDSVLGANNIDLGNGTANDKSGTLNLGVANIGANGAASVAPLFMNGAILTGGTGTTNFPAILMQPSGATAVTSWSTSGTFFGINAASGFVGNYLDFRINNGATQFSVDKSGNTKASTITLSSNRLVFVAGSSQNQAAWTTNGVQVAVGAYTWTDTTSSGTVAAQYVNAFKAPTIAASSGTVYTNSYNTYFENPVAGANVTQTNAWALGADSFKVANGSTFGGALTLGGNSIVGVGALVAGGSAPTGSGTCTRGAQTGGNTTGTILLTCTAQTLILTFTTTAPTGWMCEAIDQTTTADTMKQTSNTTTSCTLTGTTAASDVILFQARAY